MVNKDLLQLLRGFPFSEMERLIISLLVDYPTGINLQDIKKKLEQELIIDEIYLANQINVLITKNLISKMAVSPEKFLLNTKKTIQAELDMIIHATQHQLNIQKTNYHPILTIIQEIQDTGKGKSK